MIDVFIICITFFFFFFYIYHSRIILFYLIAEIVFKTKLQ